MNPILADIYSTILPSAPYIIAAYALLWFRQMEAMRLALKNWIAGWKWENAAASVSLSCLIFLPSGERPLRRRLWRKKTEPVSRFLAGILMLPGKNTGHFCMLS